MTSKTCEHCGADFRPYRHYQRFCSKTCNDRALYKKNQDAVKERAAAWFRDNHQRALESRREYYHANKDARKEKRRAYNAANMEHQSQKAKAWHAKNREAHLEKMRARWRSQGLATGALHLLHVMQQLKRDEQNGKP